MTRRARGASLALVALVVAAQSAQAQLNPGPPADLQGVGLDERLGGRVPLDLTLSDETGQPVTLGRYFDGQRPVLLTLVYYRCPMLCGLVLEGLLESLRGLEWEPGRQFEIVTVSIDPAEGAALAQAKKRSQLEAYGRPQAAAGWHFLTGSKESIDALADSVGFRYRWLPEVREYAHPATLILLGPDGRIARYLSGVQNDPRTLRLALVEAGAGKIGTPLDQFLLYCYRYDAERGSYAPVARRIMRLAGGATVLVLGAVLVGLWRRDVRRRG